MYFSTLAENYDLLDGRADRELAASKIAARRRDFDRVNNKEVTARPTFNADTELISTTRVKADCTAPEPAGVWSPGQLALSRRSTRSAGCAAVRFWCAMPPIPVGLRCSTWSVESSWKPAACLRTRPVWPASMVCLPCRFQARCDSFRRCAGHRQRRHRRRHAAGTGTRTRRRVTHRLARYRSIHPIGHHGCHGHLLVGLDEARDFDHAPRRWGPVRSGVRKHRRRNAA